MLDRFRVLTSKNEMQPHSALAWNELPTVRVLPGQGPGRWPRRWSTNRETDKY